MRPLRHLGDLDRKPCTSAQRVMRSSISAQSLASVPPAPELIDTMALAASCSPPSRRRSSARSSSSVAASSFAAASARVGASACSSASSSSTPASSSDPASRSKLPISRSTALFSRSVRSACSRLSQRSGRATSRSSAASRARMRRRQSAPGLGNPRARGRCAAHPRPTNPSLRSIEYLRRARRHASAQPSQRPQPATPANVTKACVEALERSRPQHRPPAERARRSAFVAGPSARIDDRRHPEFAARAVRPTSPPNAAR